MSLVWFSGVGVIYAKNLRSVGHLQKFEMHDVYIQAYAAVSAQQICSHSVWKLARDLKVGPLDCARSALHTETNFIFGPLKMKTL